MSDHSSPASEDSTSDSSERVCELCGSASRTPTASESSLSIGPESPAIPTCAPWWPTPDASVANYGEGPTTWLARREELKKKGYNGNGAGMPLAIAAQLDPMERGTPCPCRCHTSMSSAAASPAKTSAMPDEERESTERARVFGPSTRDSLANFDPDTSSWRTSQLSLLEDSGECLQTWPRSGMTRSGIAYQRQPLAPLTGATASGSLPTPTAKANMMAPSMQKWAAHRNLWPTPTARDHKDTGDLSNVPENSLLPRVVQRMERESWPTPTASEGTGPGHAAQGGKNQEYPTPTATNTKAHHMRSGGREARSYGAHGQLNPTWVEWLQGFPLGWTEVD